MTRHTYRLDLATREPLSLNDRMHHMKVYRLKRALLDDVGWQVRANRLPRMEFAHLALHYRPAVNRRRDADNLVATLKVATDAIVRAGVLEDDTPRFVTQDMPVIEPVVKGQPAALWVLVTDMSGDEA